MSLLSEFREFAVKGSVIDLAVGVIIGAAFNRIVDSLVKDVVMPVIGFFTGGLDFTNFFFALKPVPADVAPTLEAVKAAGVPVVAWGQFITVALHFVILAFVVFMMIRQVNRLRRQEKPKETPAPAEPPDIALLREIRDTLRAK